MGRALVDQPAPVAAPSAQTLTTRPLQRACACAGLRTCESCRRGRPLARSATGLAAPLAPPVVHEVLASPGEPLAADVGQAARARLGFDFSRVRIHADDHAARSADAVAARAYTAGEHVVFAAGQYQPTTAAGQALLAHELTHVRQQAGAPTTGELVVGEPDAPAEREAEAAATGAPTSASAPSEGRWLRRDAQSGLIAGGLGAAGGAAIGALGFLLGPLGGLIGMLVGGVVGGLVTGLAVGLTTDREDRGAGEEVLAAVRRLLAPSFLHPVITGEDARRALAALATLAPMARLRAYNALLAEGLWYRLVDTLPAGDTEARDDFLTSISPESGPVTAGDQFQLEFWNLDDKLDYPTAPPVAEDGWHGPDLPADQPAYVVGLPVDAARRAIAVAYGEAQLVDHTKVWLKLRKRGPAYGARGGAVADDGVWLDITPTTEATRGLRRTSEFRRHLGKTSGLRPEVAAAYQAALGGDLGRYASPEHLLRLVEALTPPPPPPAPDPEQEWHAVGAAILRSQLAHPIASFAGAYERWHRIFELHLAKGDLAKHDPWAAYGQALREAGAVNQAQWEADYQRKADEKKKDQAAAAAVDKVVATYDAVIKHVLTSPVPPVTYAADKERGVGYLAWRNPVELKLRAEMATQIMAQVRAHMNDPDFAKQTPIGLIADWMTAHPLAGVMLQYSMSHPATEQVAIPVEIPAWQTATEILVGLIPVVGQIVAGYEVISGEDLFGHKLGPVERGILAAAILLPAAAKAFKLGKGAITAARLIEDFGPMSKAEAAAVYRAMIPVQPGSFGAKLLEEAVGKVKGGAALKPAEVQEIEKLFAAMGLTDKAQAKALAKSAVGLGEAEARVAKAIERDIGLLGTLNPETVDLLRKNPAVVQSLLEHALANRVLKSCHSFCYPPSILPEQIAELDRQLQRLGKTGAVDEAALETFLHAERDNLNRAIAQIAVAQDAAALNAKLPFLVKKGLAAMDTAAQAKAALAAKKEASEAIGTLHGRIQAGKDGLVDVGFVNPFEHIGSHGQGFDEIMASSAKLDDKATILYVIDYKGGKAALHAGSASGLPPQLSLDWVVHNIQRLYYSGGTDGKTWAKNLAKALEEGRLHGRVYSTKDAIAGTVRDDLGAYPRFVVPFP